MPEITVDFEVWCSCGAGLCNQTSVKTDRGGTSITVEPCQTCLDQARDEGYDEGYRKGHDEGYEEGGMFG